MKIINIDTIAESQGYLPEANLSLLGSIDKKREGSVTDGVLSVDGFFGGIIADKDANPTTQAELFDESFSTQNPALGTSYVLAGLGRGFGFEFRNLDSEIQNLYIVFFAIDSISQRISSQPQKHYIIEINVNELSTNFILKRFLSSPKSANNEGWMLEPLNSITLSTGVLTRVDNNKYLSFLLPRKEDNEIIAAVHIEKLDNTGIGPVIDFIRISLDDFGLEFKETKFAVGILGNSKYSITGIDELKRSIYTLDRIALLGDQ